MITEILTKILPYFSRLKNISIQRVGTQLIPYGQQLLIFSFIPAEFPFSRIVHILHHRLSIVPLPMRAPLKGNRAVLITPCLENRFYAGEIKTGAIRLLTLSGLGLWELFDFLMIIFGEFTNKGGNILSEWTQHYSGLNKKGLGKSILSPNPFYVCTYESYFCAQDPSAFMTQ